MSSEQRKEVIIRSWNITDRFYMYLKNYRKELTEPEFIMLK
ncbi:MAG: hypothetical protein QXL94_04705 [Candidatus Parvarchaeum sp.]